jgi:hypothetical protein
MFAFTAILVSTLAGLFGFSHWAAVACGLVLACLAVAERLKIKDARLQSRQQAIALACLATVILAQLTSIGTFAVGRVLGGVLFV